MTNTRPVLSTLSHWLKRSTVLTSAVGCGVRTVHVAPPSLEYATRITAWFADAVLLFSVVLVSVHDT